MLNNEYWLTANRNSSFLVKPSSMKELLKTAKGESLELIKYLNTKSLRLLVTFFFIMSYLPLFAQNIKTPEQVLGKDSLATISKALVKVIFTSTNDTAWYVIDLPDSSRYLEVPRKDFRPGKIHYHPEDHYPLRLNLQSLQSYQMLQSQRRQRDSIIESAKQSLSVSMLEFFAVAIAGRYEYFPFKRHSVGVHASFYLYGRNPLNIGSEYDYYPVFYGVKLAPAYRFYPLRKKVRLFIEGKVPLGYFYFSKLPYHYGQSTSMKVDIQYQFFTAGYSAAVGACFPLRKGMITISIGYQYFPIKVPDTYESEVGGQTITYTTDTNWWYKAGPGSKLEIKFLLGEIF